MQRPASILMIVLLGASAASAQHRITTLGATAARGVVGAPTAIAVDRNGVVYLTSEAGHRVYRIGADGVPVVVAGSGERGFSGDGGDATRARLNAPRGLAFDKDGNLLVSDSLNDRIRRITLSTGVIETYVGSGRTGFAGDGGPALAADLDAPAGLTTDAAGNLYVVDGQNWRVRKIAADSGVVTSVAGEGFSRAVAAPAAMALLQLGGIAVDPRGIVYVTEIDAHRLRRIDPATGSITTLATSVRVTGGVAIDSVGNVFISDAENHRIQEVMSGGLVRTFAGHGYVGAGGDGQLADESAIGNPGLLAIDANGNVYVVDARDGGIRVVYRPAIITIRTEPEALAYTVDGRTYRGPQQLAWIPGSTHLLESEISQRSADGRQVRSAMWSRTGASTVRAVADAGQTSYTVRYAIDERAGGVHAGGLIRGSLDAGDLVSLSVLVTGTGVGKVVSSGGEIKCPPVCAAFYNPGGVVSLLPSAGAGSVFTGWSDACSGTGACEVTMDASKTVIATFDLVTFPLTVAVEGTGAGTVTVTPPGGECSAVCTVSIPADEVVRLEATADPGSTFIGWAGSCTGTDPICDVTVDAAKSVTALFTAPTFNITVSKSGAGTGRVTSSPAGVDCGPVCTAVFRAGSVVVLTAGPDAGVLFSGWSGACAGAEPACDLTLDSDMEVTATFATTPTFTLTVDKVGSGSGRVNSLRPGIACGPTCSASFPTGTDVELRAFADPGMVFAGWSGACVGADLFCVVTMDAIKAVTATFNLPPSFSLTVIKTGDGTGRVRSTPLSDIDCGTSCSASFVSGTAVTLTAIPDTGVRFVGWSGPCTGVGTCSVTVDASVEVTAQFSLPRRFSLTVTKAGSGTGRVRSTPSGVDCGTVCAADFIEDAVVTLAAVAESGMTFVGWSGACAGVSGPCVVTMDTAKAVSATFMAPTPVPLTVLKRGTGTGDVVSAPTGITCGLFCTADFPPGTSVVLTATAAAGMTFAGWSGACEGLLATCGVTMDAASTVTATFTALPTYMLSVTKTGSGHGTVASPPVIDCGSACSASYPAGARVTLIAAPDAGSFFAGWSGACVGIGECVVTMTDSRTVSATFTTMLTYTLHVTAGPGGRVTSSPAAIDCGSACTAAFSPGAHVVLTALPDARHEFSGWSGACHGLGACEVTMDGSLSVTAGFADRLVELVVTRAGTGTGLVRSSPDPTINCGLSCTARFTIGTDLTLTASSDPGSNFIGWFGACTGTGVCVVSMDGPKAVTASFDRPSYRLTVTRAGTGTGTVIFEPTGVPPIACGATCTALVPSLTPVNLRAIPDSGMSFGGWSEGPCSGLAPCLITMDADQSVTATFSAPTFRLTIAKAGDGTGRVLSSPAGIDCGATCSSGFLLGTPVTLRAEPDSGVIFRGWSGACAGAGDCSVTMDAAKTAIATFDRARRPLVVTKSGVGTGRVTSSPPGIDCGPTCRADFPNGAIVSLTAEPAAGMRFLGWAGSCSGIGPCVLTMDIPHAVVARFGGPAATLTMTTAGSGTGTVNSIPGGISCPATCAADFPIGARVRLVHREPLDSRFIGWSGACSGVGDCDLTMDAAKDVTATFVTATYSLTVNKVGSGTGGVTSSVPGIDCGPTCTAVIPAGTRIVLVATPAPGSTFAGWSGACTGTGRCELLMSAVRSVTAAFSVRTFTLVVLKSGLGSGDVVSSPSGINCGPVCTAAFPADTDVTLTATPGLGSSFGGWGGPCTVTGTYTCTVSSDALTMVHARFIAATATLIVLKVNPAGGRVTSLPPGIDCGFTCEASFPTGTRVTLQAFPAAGWRFVAWTGACGGSDACVVTLEDRQLVVARFAR